MGKYDAIFALDKKIMDIGSIALSLLRLPTTIKDKKIMQKNIEVNKHKKSDKCFIIGLGPSLKNVDLEKIDGDIMVTNRFTNFDGADKVRPTYYCLTDGFFYDHHAIDILEKAMDMYPDSVFLLNGKFRHQAENVVKKNITRYYAYMWSGFFDSKKEIDFTKLVPIMGNIVCFAIMVALYLGYKEIILLGCDFNSFASRKPIHCYTEETSKRQISMSFELFCYSFVADTHYELNQYAERHGQKIINATDGSLIDAYYYDNDIIKKYLKDNI